MAKVVYENGARILFKGYCFLKEKDTDTVYKCTHCSEVTITVNKTTRILSANGAHKHPPDSGWRFITFRRLKTSSWVTAKIEGEHFKFNLPVHYPVTNTLQPLANLKKGVAGYSIQTSWPIANEFQNTIIECDLCMGNVIRQDEIEHRKTMHSLQNMFSDVSHKYLLNIDESMTELFAKWEALPLTDGYIVPDANHYISIPMPAPPSTYAIAKNLPSNINCHKYHQFVIDMFVVDCLTLDNKFEFGELYSNHTVANYFKGFIGGRHDGRYSDLPRTKHLVAAIPNVTTAGSLRFRYQLPDGREAFMCSEGGCSNVALLSTECERHQHWALCICSAMSPENVVLVAVVLVQVEKMAPDAIARVTEQQFKRLVKHVNIETVNTLWSKRYRGLGDQYQVERESIKTYLYLLTEAWNAKRSIRIDFVNQNLLFPPQAAYEALHLAEKCGLKFLIPTLKQIVPLCPGLESCREVSRPLYNATYVVTKENFVYFYQNKQHYYIGAKKTTLSYASDSNDVKTKSMYEIENGPYEAYKMLFVAQDENVNNLESICQILFFIKCGLDLMNILDRNVSYEPLKLINWRCYKIIPGILSDISALQMLACSVLENAFLYSFEDKCKDPNNFLQMLCDIIDSHTFSSHRGIFEHPLPGYSADTEDSFEDE